MMHACNFRVGAGLLILTAVGSPAHSQSLAAVQCTVESIDTASTGSTLGEVVVNAARLDLNGTATTASEGKANQYLMRAYNLDHDTDLAVFIDDMPVNEPSHTHGQGYTDLNFLIPELATNLRYTKGPCYADQGDFASVGSIHVRYLDTIRPQASMSVGSLDYQRLFAAGSFGLGTGNLLGALEHSILWGTNPSAVQHPD